MFTELLMNRLEARPNEAKGFELSLLNFEFEITRYGTPCYEKNMSSIMSCLTDINDDMKSMRHPEFVETSIERIREQLQAMLSQYLADDCIPGY